MTIRTQPVSACQLCTREGRTLYCTIDRNQFVPGTWSIRWCQSCALAWLDPQPIPEDVSLAYPDSYYTHTAEVDRPSLGASPLMRALRGAVLSARYGYYPLCPQIPLAGLMGHVLALIPEAHRRATLNWLRAVPPYKPSGKLLEIGCGEGNYLVSMRTLGWEVSGIEPDEAAASRAALASGAKIWPTTIEEADVPQESFDAVVAQHSIEHVRDPALFLGRAVSWLRPGGWLYITTPNFASLTHRRFHQDWLALDVPRHLNLLTPRSLRALADRTGRLHVRSLRTLTRRARREQEHAYAVRATGNFNAKFRPTTAQAVAMAIHAAVEKAGNRFLQWGEELELIATKM